MNPSELLICISVLVLFVAGTALMITRKLPALLTLPLLGAAIAGVAAIARALLPQYGPAISGMDVLAVLSQGALYLHKAAFVAFFGGVIGFLMQKSGTAHNMVKGGAELIGDNPLWVCLGSLALIAFIFTSIGGLGAIIMVALVVLPMMATVGVQPATAGGIFLIGLSMGGVLNAGNWVLYTVALGVPIGDVKTFAAIVFALMLLTGTLFICVELFRGGAAKSKTQLGVVLGVVALLGAGIVAFIVSGSKGAGSADPSRAPLVLAWEAPGTVPYLQIGNPPDIEVDPQEVSGTGMPDVTPEDSGPSKDRANPYQVTEVALPGKLLLRLDNPTTTTASTVLEVSRESQDAETLFDANWGRYDLLRLPYEASAEGTLFLELIGDAKTERLTARVGKPGTPHVFEWDLRQSDPAVLANVQSLRISFQPKKDTPRATVEVSSLSLVFRAQTPLWLKALRIVVSAMLAIAVLVALVDVWKRIPRWRHQIVTIKWYAYLIPAIPLALIFAFNMDPIPAFLIGIVYSFLATARPGSMSLLIQSLIQGFAAVLPAVLLFVGIGILLQAVMGPAGWSEAHGGAPWPVTDAIEPLLLAMMPKSPLMYVLAFGLAAPLALYRGPLNTWGLGLALTGVLSLALPPAAVMAMLMTVGQVQGVCDPTNTHNVWLANELRVDVQKLLWKTIPYIWGMVFLGLAVAAMMHWR